MLDFSVLTELSDGHFQEHPHGGALQCGSAFIYWPHIYNRQEGHRRNTDLLFV